MKRTILKSPVNSLSHMHVLDWLTNCFQAIFFPVFGNGPGIQLI